jgi:SNF2 family DNA or RNA helicase
MERVRPYDDSDFVDWQIADSDAAAKAKRFIIGHKMGLGKTRIASRAMSFWDFSRFLIVCSKNGMLMWKREMLKLGLPATIISGNKLQRKELWRRARLYNCVPICTHAVFRNDILEIGVNWDGMLVDELHRACRKKSAQIFKCFQYVARNCEYLLLLTGSPARKGPHNLWIYFNLLNHKLFSSYWRFVNTYCWVNDTGFGKEILGVKNEEELKALLRRHGRFRTWKEVLPNAPKKTKQFLEVEMDDEQEGVYKQLEAQCIAEVGSEGDLLVAPSDLSLIMKFRQLLVCPKILHPELGYGAGIEAICEAMADEEETHFVVFTPFAKALPHLYEYVTDVRGYKSVGVLQGGMSTEDMEEIVARSKRERGLLLCTIQYATTFDLETMWHAFFLGAEWSIDDNEQAEYRLIRFITNHPVNINYVRYNGTIDDHVFEALDFNNRTVTSMLRPRTRGDVVKLIKRAV